MCLNGETVAKSFTSNLDYQFDRIFMFVKKKIKPGCCL